jgi:hypothetical protein
MGLGSGYASDKFYDSGPLAGMPTYGTAVSGGADDNSPPVKVAGTDGMTVRTLKTNTQGSLLIGSGSLGAASVTGAAQPTFILDGNSTPRPLGSALYVYNGASTDVTRSASASDNTIGTGLIGAGILGQYLANLTNYADGRFGTLAMTSRGILMNALVATDGAPVPVRSPADGAPLTSTRGLLVVSNGTYLFDEALAVQTLARGNANGAFVVSVPSALSPGVTQFSAMSAASDNAQTIKNTRGKVLGFQIFNTTASAKYVRLYDKATAPVVADTGLIRRRIMVPANGVASYHVGQGLDGFPNGISLRATGAAPDADTTVLAVGDLIFNIDYI